MINDEKTFLYFQKRVQEKIADFERYEFGKREKNHRSKAEVLNILQELIRESRTPEESDYFSRAILLENYGYQSCIYYLEEEKDDAGNVTSANFWDFKHQKRLPDYIQGKIIQEQTVINSPKRSEAFFPIRGNATIKQETKYPANERVIIGALEVDNKEGFDKQTIFFLEKYCRRMGMGIHFHKMLEYNKRLNQHILNMLTAASHDLRGPLNSIAVGLKVIQRELYGKLDPRVKEAVGKLYQKANSLYTTLETYLGETSLFSGHLKIKKELLDYRMDIIDPLLEEFSELFAGANITIDESMGGIPAGKITINADRIWLLSVYRNLFSNVAKYGGWGCTMAFGFEDWEDHYRFNVFNTGRPLDFSDQRKLFQKFSRIEGQNTSVKGAGLGLYFAREVIEHHGGKIWYEAKQDGSNFVFTLPKE